MPRSSIQPYHHRENIRYSCLTELIVHHRHRHLATDGYVLCDLCVFCNNIYTTLEHCTHCPLFGFHELYRVLKDIEEKNYTTKSPGFDPPSVCQPRIVYNCRQCMKLPASKTRPPLCTSLSQYLHLLVLPHSPPLLPLPLNFLHLRWLCRPCVLQSTHK